jgi:Domain of unknown function (DUF6378)
MRAPEVYQLAADLVGGDRALQRGDMQSVRSRIAALWSAHLNHPVAAHDVELMLLFARTGATFNSDGYIHAASYAGIAAEFASNA